MSRAPLISSYWREITSIVEAGLKPDPARVSAFAEHLASRLDELGEGRLAERIRRLTKNASRPSGSTFLLQRLPSDVEAQQPLVEELFPTAEPRYPILPYATSQELERFVQLNKRADELYARDIEPPTSLLLFGPPGCGKTMAAAAISADLRLPLLLVRLDSLVGSYLGNSAKNLRRIFDTAVSRPSILFLDEFDAIGKMRDDIHEVGEIKRLVVGLLQNLDRVRGHQIVIAATNHDHMLDSAVWRRFDIILHIAQPGKDQLRRIVQDLLSGQECPPAGTVDALATIAQGLSGSGVASALRRALQDSVLTPSDPIVGHIAKAFLAAHQQSAGDHVASNKKDLILAIHGRTLGELSMRQIARLVGCSPTYVHEILQTV